MKLPFYIFNVFAESNWGGNPLAIVPLLDESLSIDTETMQRIARQFNLSETVFITPAIDAWHVAHLRIFTPDHEMPFAGHPTIGAAAWLHQNLNLSDTFTLTTPAKTVSITHQQGTYRFTLSGYTHAPCALSRAQLANGLGLMEADLGEYIRWMNAGTWQLVIPLNSRAAVTRAQANTPLLRDASVDAAHTNAYIWFEETDKSLHGIFSTSTARASKTPVRVLPVPTSGRGRICMVAFQTARRYHGTSLRPKRLTAPIICILA